MRKKIKIFIKSNLNRNAEALSLSYFCKKVVLKNVIIFTGKHLCVGVSSSLQLIKKDSRFYEVFAVSGTGCIKTINEYH